jgi:hypothetical protein
MQASEFLLFIDIPSLMKFVKLIFRSNVKIIGQIDGFQLKFYDHVDIHNSNYKVMIHEIYKIIVSP